MGDAAERIMRCLGEALAHARGEDVAELVVRISAMVDVAAVRRTPEDPARVVEETLE